MTAPSSRCRRLWTSWYAEVGSAPRPSQGFYKKEPTGEILTLDPASMTYRPEMPARLPSLDAARSIDDAGARIKALFTGRDKVGKFLRDTLGPTLVYTARVAPDVAYSIDDVDRAMRWGFGWELGPFETWDAIGIEQVLDAGHVSDPPPLVRDALSRGAFRPRESDRPYVPVPPAGPGVAALEDIEGASHASYGETPAPA